MLRQLPASADPRLLVGQNPADDAAVYEVRPDLALVQTVDFFTPVVDDPYTFGQIAATNALSDVYAMGGTPLTALNIAAFPIDQLGAEVISAVLRGSGDKVAEAGAAVVGGHTVEDAEPKFGLAVTGIVDPREMVTSRGARPGDLLVLTKPLGTGVITTALKAEKAEEHHVQQAVQWMTTLNRAAASAMRETGAHAATDVTGFGLLGHLADLCHASGVRASIQASAVPLLPGALDYAERGFVPGGTRANLRSLSDEVRFDAAIDEVARVLLADAQTSGGLLVSLAPDRLPAFAQAAGTAAVVGRVLEPADGPAISVEP